MLQGKNIVLGVGGGIAAYKVADIASKLSQAGASVHTVLTQSAARFVTPLTFQALTHLPVFTSLFVSADNGESGSMAAMPHIGLADSADLVLVAPATADLIARLAAGLADDLLTTLVLATRAPIVLAPAMNPTMLAHAATQRNLTTLVSLGYHLLPSGVGHMACEHVGLGRLPETAQVLAALEGFFSSNTELSGRQVVVTAGPTQERLDPVRYLTNRSSGKMGYALAQEAARRGAQVTLISGPTALPVPPGVTRVEVVTADEMLHATLSAFAQADYLIAAAAPADFRPSSICKEKIKRGKQKSWTLTLEANIDIVARCAAERRAGQMVVGFAAETGDPVPEGRRKLREKGLDALVANDVTAPGAGFEADTNQVTWLTRQVEETWPVLPKSEVARLVWDKLTTLESPAAL